MTEILNGTSDDFEAIQQRELAYEHHHTFFVLSELYREGIEAHDGDYERAKQDPNFMTVIVGLSNVGISMIEGQLNRDYLKTYRELQGPIQ